MPLLLSELDERFAFMKTCNWCGVCVASYDSRAELDVELRTKATMHAAFAFREAR